MQITNPGESAANEQNLYEFFALLYKIDLRNKREKRVRDEEQKENKNTQSKNEDVNDVV